MTAATTSWRAGLVLASALTLAACASAPPPTDAITNAELAVQQAETAQAAQYAAGDLLRAREKLNTAKSEVDQEHYSKAQRLAEESEADAQLAAAKSREAVALKVQQDAEANVQALREESAPKTPAVMQTPLSLPPMAPRTPAMQPAMPMQPSTAQ
jgi:hypothetical protein